MLTKSIDQAWIGDLLRNSSQQDITGESGFVQAYFKAFTVQLSICTVRSKPSETHYSLQSRLHQKFWFSPDKPSHKTFNGSISTWVKSLVSVKKSNLSPAHCWRRNRESGTQDCTGMTVSTTLHVSMPIVLVIETSSATPQWTFEERIALMPKKEDIAEVSYELVGRILYSYPSNHYIARFEGKLDSLQQSPPIYNYDSLCCRGRSAERAEMTCKSVKIR